MPPVAAYLGVLIVVTVPGALVAYLLRLRLNTLLTWALVPVLSLATVFVLGELTAATRMSFGVPAFLLLILALGGVAFVKRMLDHSSRQIHRLDRSSEPPDEPRVGEKVAYGLLV